MGYMVILFKYTQSHILSTKGGRYGFDILPLALLAPQDANDAVQGGPRVRIGDVGSTLNPKP